MAKKKKIPASEYSINHIKLTEYSASVDASINYKVRDARNYESNAKVYGFTSSLELKGIYIYSDDRDNEEIQLTVHGTDEGPLDFDTTLADCQASDDKGNYKFRKMKGQEIPVYDVPKGIGHLERQRGTKIWSGFVWVNHQIITNMLTLLPTVSPLYLTIHERKVERNRYIVGLTLQTNHPDEE